MTKVTYTIKAAISVETDMEESLQDHPAALVEQAKAVLSQRLTLLDIAGGRFGGVVTIDLIEEVSA